ncbi:MAG: hypothetical protein GX166_01970 [Clostridiaceae bacterium]|nr:hypothetical protein [Clostridiaceae bacterium]
MKLKTMLGFAIILVLILAPTNVRAENEPIVYDFYFEESFFYYVGTATNVEIEWVDNHLHLVTLNGPDQGGNGDPYFGLLIDPFDGDLYQWCKIKIKNNSNAEFFQFHFDAGSGIRGESNTLVPISKDDEEFKEYVFNMKDRNLATAEWSQDKRYPFTLEESLWTGTIRSIRLDCMFTDFPGGQILTGSEFDLEYIAFFTSEEEALNFTPDRTRTPTPEPTKTPDPTKATTPTPTKTSTSTSTPAEQKDEKSESFPIYYVVIPIAVIVVAAIVVILLKRKKK